MRCSKARELISDALDAHLDESHGIDLTRHLENCADCHQHQLVLERGQALLREGLVEAPDNFEWKVQLKIQQALREQVAGTEPVSGWRFWRPALGSAMGVALVVVLAGGLLLAPDGPRLDAGSAQPGASRAVTAASPSIAEAVTAQPAPAEPDLSRAVRGKPLQFNAANGRFGIRTVADEGFLWGSPLSDPVGQSRWRQERGDEGIEVRRIMIGDSQAYYMWHRWVYMNGAGLNLGGQRSRLPETLPVSGGHSTPDQPGS